MISFELQILQLVRGVVFIYISTRIHMRKIVLLFAAAAIFCTANGLAQNTFPMSIGPFIAPKVCVNTADIPQGFKTGMSFNGIPDFGATFYVPFSPTSTIGATADVGYSTYSILTKPESNANDDNTFIEKVNYFSIAPNINFSGFMLGFNIGIPMGYSVSNVSGSINPATTTDNLATIVDIRIGGMIPLMNDATGRLNFIVFGGYMLTGMSSNDNTSANPKAASLMLGLNYLFALEKAKAKRVTE
jgi:hypothetical protein